MESGGDTPIDTSTDFEGLSARLRTQSANAPGSDTDRVTIRSLADVSTDSLSNLLEAAETDDADGTVDPLVFVVSLANAARLTEREFDIDGIDDLEEALGRPVQVEDGLPDDTICCWRRTQSRAPNRSSR